MSGCRLSFWLMVGVWVLTAALAFVLTLSHLLALAADLGAIAGLRWVAHWEARGGDFWWWKT